MIAGYLLIPKIGMKHQYVFFVADRKQCGDEEWLWTKSNLFSRLKKEVKTNFIYDRSALIISMRSK